MTRKIYYRVRRSHNAKLWAAERSYDGARFDVIQYFDSPEKAQAECRRDAGWQDVIAADEGGPVNECVYL